MPSNLCRLRITLTDEQWDDVFEIVASHLRENVARYPTLESLEFRGICEDVDEQEDIDAILGHARADVKAKLPLRYSAVTKVLD